MKGKNNITSTEYWQKSIDALRNGELDKAAEFAFQARKKEAQSKGCDFSESSPFGNPLHAKEAASEINNLEIPTTSVSQETKANIRTEVAFGILKGENPRTTERKSRAILEDFEWPEFDQWCNNFMRINEWPPLWETVGAFHEIQAYPIEALLNELRKEQLLQLAKQYSATARKSHKKEMIIKLLVDIIPEQDRTTILTLVNKLWKPRYLREKRFLLIHMLSNQAFKSAALSEFEAAEKVIGLEVKVQWWSAGDERVCSICASRHGKIYTRAEAQKIMVACPNCRCAFLPHIQEDN